MTWIGIKIGIGMVLDYTKDNMLGINEVLLGLLTGMAILSGQDDYNIYLVAWVILGSLRVVRDVIIDSRDRILCELKFKEDCNEVIGC